MVRQVLQAARVAAAVAALHQAVRARRVKALLAGPVHPATVATHTEQVAAAALALLVAPLLILAHPVMAALV